MRIRTDDEVYRVDAVWLGPPKATFPWRARYVAWGVGIPLFLVTLGVERQLGFGFGFFTTAWAFVITIALTRLITAKISHERPLSAVFAMWMRELQAPREKTSGTGGAASASKIKVRTERPRPKRARGRARRPAPRYDHHPPVPGRAVSTASPVRYPSRESTARARRRRTSAPVGR
ncbi:hypothetical protein [Prauserella flavalba]|uniref:Uncharacterized protein n=1 Tax=Prauserella flavalba TaxID=1477506 RepID=A0A318ME96_9PSEU|nr:hypothetical protein [Prauserella flavalba]PXY37430.1 hypothetical protein BA062_06830 [Prauserella flavalba]